MGCTRYLTSLYSQGAARPAIFRAGKFMTVSLVAMGTTILVLAVAELAGLSDTVATFIATSAAAVPAFELSRRWVWSERRGGGLTTKVVAFWAMAFARLGLAVLAVSMVSGSADKLGQPLRAIVTEGTMLTTYAVMWAGQFAVLDKVLFRARHHGQETVTAASGDQAVQGMAEAH